MRASLRESVMEEGAVIVILLVIEPTPTKPDPAI